MRLPALLLGLLALSQPLLASDFGKPLGCEDFVFLQPGLSCAVVNDCGTWPFRGIDTQFCSITGASEFVDNSGRLIGWVRQELEPPNDQRCAGVYRWELRALNTPQREILGYIDDQRTPDGSGVQHFMRGFGLFDPLRGRLFLEAQADCESVDCGPCDPNAPFSLQLIVISGFPHPHRRP